MEDYLRLTGGHMSLAEALAQPGAEFDFNPRASAADSSNRPISADVSARHQCHFRTETTGPPKFLPSVIGGSKVFAKTRTAARP